jgi:hypothetical protein
MKTTLQIFINQRFWKEVETTVDSKGYLDLTPAHSAITDAETTGSFSIFAIRNPKELTSIEIRPVYYSIDQKI